MAAEPSSPVSGRETFKTYLRKVGSGEHTSKGPVSYTHLTLPTNREV